MFIYNRHSTLKYRAQHGVITLARVVDAAVYLCTLTMVISELAPYLLYDVFANK